MVINRERRWVYLGPPKTGSTTLTYLLTDGDDWNNRRPLSRRIFGGLKYAGQHAMDIPDECRDYLVFASVRNPYSRAVSLWWQWNIQSERTREHSASSFEEFLEALLGWQENTDAESVPGNGFYHFTLNRWFKWVPRVHRYIRQEALAEDLNRLGLAEPVVAPLQNSAPDFRSSMFGSRVPGDWMRFCTPKAVDLIRQWACEDFENLGYSADLTESVA